MNNEVGCVIVTYNRLSKLKKALEAYSHQEKKPAYIIVVDNASTDGTGEFLRSWQMEECTEERCVLTLEQNAGGSGGFYAGQKMALEKSADWIMLADDDAYPEVDYLSGLMKYVQNNNAGEISVVCGLVEQRDSVNNEHRVIIEGKYKWQFYKKIPVNLLKCREVYIDMCSYVGPLISVAKLREAGLVNKDYFIWQDDFEHCIRLGKVGKIICLPSYKIIHDADAAHMELSWKTYYAWRNGMDLRKKHFSTILFVLAIINALARICLSPLHGRGVKEIVARLKGVKDGLSGELGVHHTYRPGWKP